MLMSALKLFRAIRFSNETYDFIQHENLLCGKANSKIYYNLLRKQKCSDSNALDKLNRTFINDYFQWKLVYSMKIRNQFEMSISEFNYKLVYSLLPTKSNLFKWKKVIILPAYTAMSYKTLCTFYTTVNIWTTFGF